MQNCLLKIAALLNRQGISWALGASMLLYYKGLAAKPNDIDLMIAPESAEAADKILAALGTRQPPNPSANYATTYIAEYVVDGVEVDVMAGFAIRHAGGCYEYRLEPVFFETLCIGGTKIYLCPLEDWYVLYMLMPHRQARVASLEAYFQTTEFSLPRLQFWLKEPLPPAIKERLRAFLN
ncbi:MAG: hypothetical protein ACK5L3_07100 [Oscillospiraceae bacterium]